MLLSYRFILKNSLKRISVLFGFLRYDISMKVLIVEDEIRLAQSLKELLEKANYQVDMVHDGQEAIFYATQTSYDLIVLDVMLPIKNGFEVIEELRLNNIKSSIIFLSAKDTSQDKIHGLNLGADDYLSKPFDPNELLARLSALARRKQQIYTEVIEVNGLSLNTNNHQLSYKGKDILLNNKEYLIMEALIKHPSQVFSKEWLIENIWGFDSEAMDNNVEAYISFLRRKLEFIECPFEIKTLRKIGYSLEVNHD